MLPAGARGAGHGPAGTDQVVNDQDRRALDGADQQLAADHPGTAPLFHERPLDRPGEHSLQHLAEQLGPLDATRIRRGDDDGAIRDKKVLARSANRRRVSRWTVRQRKAFWNATML
jgi:hypothetical protein